MSLIRLDHLYRTFKTSAGDFEAVKDVSLSIDKGEAFGIIGKSGAGKSTLLRLINLLERPDQGKVSIEGEELTRLSKSALRDARQSIGMIFQQFNLLQNSTVFSNVAFPLKIRRNYNKQQTEDRVSEVLDFVGLKEKRNSYPAQLSGGQKQRVAIARALASHPSVLLCDEPTSALDPETTRSIIDVLRDINARLGVTLVIVSHELALVRALCTRVAIMEQGQIVEQVDLGNTAQIGKTSLARELAERTAQEESYV